MFAVTIFTAFLLLLPFSAPAQEIEFDKIEEVALKVFSLNSGRSVSNLKISKILPIYADKEVAYYIFNFEPYGHITVSTNKAFEPILGYGLNSTINFDSIPPGLKCLLDNYKNEINQSKKQKIVTSKETASKWDDYINLDVKGVLKSYSPESYLLQTKWGQESGYNRFCPLDPVTNLRTIVGCGGVALGQILYYWQCRVFPDNSITYTPARFTAPLTVNFYGQNYNWSGMSKTSSDDYNALLLYHTAVAIRADFGNEATNNYATNTRTALISYFGFNANNVQYKSSYTNENWIDMLKTEINAERPIYYSGYNYTEEQGHAWVIDGYKNDNTFHCNWGWYGYPNDWYSLSALNPGSHSYNDGQSAILNVYPKLDACSGLNGTNIICSSNSSYSISIPSSASVVWSKSSNLTQVGGNTGTSYTVYATNSTMGGIGFITATIYNSQNQVFKTRTKDAWVGMPKQPTNINFYPSTPCLNQDVIALVIADNPPISGVHYEWSGGSHNYIEFSPNGSEVHFTTLPSHAYTTNVTVRAVNDCGYFLDYTKLLTVKKCGGGIPPAPVSASINMQISPNPVTDFVTISVTENLNYQKESNFNLEDTEMILPVDFSGEFEIQLWSEYRGLIKTLKSNQPKLQISLHGLANGKYYLHLIIDGKVIKKQIILKRNNK
ncbi:hypothetical protein MASR2M117_04340 [Paludibacter sp.]